jgi:hydroxyproline O-arabinosyltransferase
MPVGFQKSTFLRCCSYYGEAVKPGPMNFQVSAEACCESCLRHRPAGKEDSPCNGVPELFEGPVGLGFPERSALSSPDDTCCCAVWVWCGDRAACGSQYQHCWLKYLPWLYASKPKQGPEVPWTTGLMEPSPSTSKGNESLGGPERRFHTVTTASGTSTHWQMRIHYYWFKKQQKACREQYGDDCHMGGFTRLLHSGSDDDLSQEIPTHVAQPLPKGDGNYIVRRCKRFAILNSWKRTMHLRGQGSCVSLRDQAHSFAGAQPAIRIPAMGEGCASQGEVHPYV